MQNEKTEVQEKESTIDEASKLLSNTYLFKEMDFDTVKSIFTEGTVEFYKKGSHPVIEGDPTVGIYMIIEGCLAVYRDDKINRQRHKIATLKKGDAFGELSLFTEQPRIATVYCETNTTLFFLGEEAFKRAIEDRDDSLKATFYKNCVQSLSKRLRTLNQDYIVSQQQLWKYALSPKQRGENQPDSTSQ